jgi:hypothetical protein
MVRLLNLADAASPVGEAANFLLNRLAELEIPEDLAREWMGHVEPAIARLKTALGNKPHRSLSDAVRLARGSDAPPPDKKGFA